jgi:hypothetical protein
VLLSVLAGGCVALAGCADPGQAVGPGAPGTTAAPNAASSAASTAASKAPGGPHTSGPVAVPASLCANTETAQDTADAFMGAVAAGDKDQAASCVYSGAVPAGQLASLLAHAKKRTAFLPDPATSTASTFVYRADGTTVSVSVTREPDGHYWVTGVSAQ